ncbi:MAG TPA: hypothetical protein VHY48_13135 [Acidobacteriaceae bacterium]|jgi:hypothetical protein|nr:hypothetical protein [Acidobacteriaceae bacterium]
MTRLELLQLVVARARSNGFELRRWYTTRLGIPWISADAAIACLDQQRRYYALLFSHEFAQCFWKPGEEITFQVAAQTFQRSAPDGSIQTVTRKPFTRRSTRKDAWRYHLRQMAVAEDPLRYIRRYLHVEEDLIEDPETASDEPTSESAAAPRGKRKHPIKSPRDLPTDLPAFLRRPYP